MIFYVCSDLCWASAGREKRFEGQVVNQGLPSTAKSPDSTENLTGEKESPIIRSGGQKKIPDAVTLLVTLEARGIELALDPDSGAIVADDPEDWFWIEANRADLKLLLSPNLETHKSAAGATE